ncbi:hypothetical protein [Kitasatospora sp. NPDC008115]|uniref:hypothetical protein n=1 Tax=Kitasatospora sp. NPDC008115 TaxID=3364022 RepID=UPI0036EE782A
MTRTTAPERGDWSRVPSLSTLVTTACLMFVLPLRGFAEMATDPCYEPGSCPRTHAALALADRLLLAAVLLTALQWPLAYLSRRARLPAGLAPGLTLLAVVVVLFTLEPGA